MNTPLQYLAWQLFTQSPDACRVRWFALRNDLRNKYHRAARKLVDEWAREDRECEDLADAMDER